MKNLKIILTALIVIAVVIAVILLLIRIFSGVMSILGGAMDTILGIVIIVALLGIVGWMFSYAKKKR